MSVFKVETTKGTKWRVQIRKKGWPNYTKNHDKQTAAKKDERDVLAEMEKGTFGTTTTDNFLTFDEGITKWLDTHINGNTAIKDKRRRDYRMVNTPLQYQSHLRSYWRKPYQTNL